MTIKAVVYDMDGVLIDSEPLWRKGEVEVFAKYGIALTEEMCFRCMGLRIDEVVAFWFKEFGVGMDRAPQAQNDILDKMVELITAEGQALPGVSSSLAFWQGKGMRLALASSSATRLIEAVLDRLGIRAYFEVIHSAEHEPFGKPHPAVYISAAQKLGVPPTECLAIEDSVNGVIAAKAARMTCIAIPEHAMRNDKRFAIADRQLLSLNDIDDRLYSAL